jgi:hypothetical protein
MHLTESGVSRGLADAQGQRITEVPSLAADLPFSLVRTPLSLVWLAARRSGVRIPLGHKLHSGPGRRPPQDCYDPHARNCLTRAWMGP